MRFTDLGPDFFAFLVPQSHVLMFLLTCRTMRIALKDVKAVVNKRDATAFSNGEGLLDSLNRLDALCKVSVLRLPHALLRVGGALALADALRLNVPIRSLDILGNELGNSGARILSLALKANTTLTDLTLSYNSITYTGALLLAEALGCNTTLETLDLGYNQIESLGARRVAQSLCINTSLGNLNLRRNQIGCRGGEHLAQGLRVNTTLESLNLDMNNMEDR